MPKRIVESLFQKKERLMRLEGEVEGLRRQIAEEEAAEINVRGSAVKLILESGAPVSVGDLVEKFELEPSRARYYLLDILRAHPRIILINSVVRGGQ